MQTKRKHFKSKCTLGADISTKDINIRLATSLTNKTATSSSYTDLQDIFSTQSAITFWFAREIQYPYASTVNKGFKSYSIKR